jgi:hypothetical protein
MDALLDAVEESFDSFFSEAAAAPLRIELDPELDQAPAVVSVPCPTLDELERSLLAVSQALSVLEGAADHLPDDLRALLAALARDTSAWARRVAGLGRE